MRKILINTMIFILAVVAVFPLTACGVEGKAVVPINISECGGIVIGDITPASTTPDYNPMTQLPVSMPITVTVSPTNATNKNVVWSVEWTSTKAVEVADYIEIVPNSPDSYNATLWCYKAFDTKIKIIATAEENDTIKAECLVDFRPRLLYKSFYFNSSTGFPSDSSAPKRVDITCSESSYVSTETIGNVRNFKYPNVAPLEFYVTSNSSTGNKYDFYSASTFPFSAGTIDKSLGIPDQTVSFALTNEFRNILSAKGITYQLITTTHGNLNLSGSASINFNGALLEQIFPGVTSNPTLMNQVKAAFVEANNTTEGAMQAYVRIEYPQSSTQPVYFFRMYLKIDPDSIRMRVSTLSAPASVVV